MPEICRFYGIIIKMFFNEHNPPHFHAEYGSAEVLIEIETMAVIAGSFPPRALGLVTEWASQHRDELLSLWDDACTQSPLHKIAPL
ncbi:MAG: DUF4160 domain-containing protein [Chitinivibrionales bacterium]|nr:DUF4160 domain-containing protein [Chitinivibrionales bacterium]